MLAVWIPVLDRLAVRASICALGSFWLCTRACCLGIKLVALLSSKLMALLVFLLRNLKNA
jgi:hypothetical protein